MWHSIQEILKKINSKLSLYDALSVAVASCFLMLLALYVSVKNEADRNEIVYYHEKATEIKREERPFASRNGTTYTYSWCQGGNKIKLENKIYFQNKEEAERSGRKLSKLCQK